MPAVGEALLGDDEARGGGGSAVARPRGSVPWQHGAFLPSDGRVKGSTPTGPFARGVGRPSDPSSCGVVIDRLLTSVTSRPLDGRHRSDDPVAHLTITFTGTFPEHARLQGVAMLRLNPGWLDYTLLAIYFVVVLGIGVVARRAVGTSADFLLAGRALPAWVTGLAFVAANLGATEIIGMAANGAEYGVATVHYYWIGAVPAMVFLGIVMMPFYYRSKVRSVPEFLRLRFGNGTHVLNAVVFAVASVLIAGVNLYALAIVLNALLGLPQIWGIVLSAAVVLVYIGFGGLGSAIYGEVLQFFVILAGLIPLAIVAVRHVGGFARARPRRSRSPRSARRACTPGRAPGSATSPTPSARTGSASSSASASSCPSATGRPTSPRSSGPSPRRTAARASAPRSSPPSRRSSSRPSRSSRASSRSSPSRTSATRTPAASSTTTPSRP